MPSTGGGTGTPIVIPDFPSSGVYDQMEELVFTPNCAVSLARYAKLINYEEAAFWGVIWENQYLRGCDPLWSEYQRMTIQNALAEAQQEIEEVVGYPLCPTYITGTYPDNPRWFDQQDFKNSKLVTRYPRIIEAGIQAVTILGASEAIDYDLVEGIGVVGPLATDATRTDQIKIFYPDSDRQITPSKITITSGMVTIQIPRYRMVRQEFLSGEDNSIRYENINFFLSSVDVKRVYTDPSTQAVLVRPGCKNGSCMGGCNECTQSACIYIRNPFLGVINIAPANWDSDLDEWSTRTICAANYREVRLNYLAGVRNPDLKMEMAIVRLAHSKMGRPPCQCDKTGQMWQKDYDTAGAITRERVNCPFGLSAGAWNAYKWALSSASIRASIL
jgi:hypothetical protein